MKINAITGGLCLLAAFSSVAVVEAKTKAPDWLADAADAANPKFDPDDRPEAVVLWDEVIHEFQENGTLMTTTRYAIRVIEPSGKARAKVFAHYRDDGTGKIIRIKAWTIDREGEVYAFKNSEVKDQTSSGYSMYSESKVKIIDGKSKCRPGTVFGYEYTREDRSAFTQYKWYFQSSIPVLMSKIEVSIPENWSFKDTRFHGAPSSLSSDNRHVWKMENLQGIKAEPKAPYRSLKRAFVTIDVVPPENSRLKRDSLAFKSWKDISNYTVEIQDPQVSPTPEIIEKAKELTDGADDIWSKVLAVGEYVKQLPYASISMDVGSGGGYTPRPASETFRVGYGDCKDKATLMRSMLQVVGIKAYPVIVNATNNDAVYPEWPSPFYFNHCIAAVEVDESVDTPAVVEEEGVGRLLFVDPTSRLTPIGELPFAEQGGYTVLGKKDMENLIRLPQGPPESNLESRRIKAELLPNGSILGRVSDRYLGKRANIERVSKLRNDEKEYKAVCERWVSGENTSAKVAMIRSEDKALEDRSFEIVLDFMIPDYAKSMRNQLLIFKPAILSRRDGHPFTASIRTMPIQMSPSLFEEESMIYLPVDFVIDDMKERIEFESEFASYSATLEQVEDKIIYKRTLRFNDTIVPAEDYSKVQEFYRSVIEADQTPVVLVRKSA